MEGGGGLLGMVLIEVFLNALVENAVGLEDEIDGIAAGALAAGVGSDVLGGGSYLIAGIGDRNGQSANPHHGQINHVIA